MFTTATTICAQTTGPLLLYLSYTLISTPAMVFNNLSSADKQAFFGLLDECVLLSVSQLVANQHAP